MELIVRQLSKNDYSDILVHWWNDWGWTPPPKEMLPNNGDGGLIIYDGNEPICAGFMYATNSSIAFIEYIISSKTYKKKPQRRDAINLLVESLTDVSKDAGFKFAFATLKSKSLINTYMKNGYTRGDSTQEMIKVL